MRRISTVAIVALVALGIASEAHAAKANTSLEIFDIAS